jgi:hypothetical protein
LVEKDKIASSVGAMTYNLLHAGVFLIFVEPLPGKLDECRDAIINEVERELEKLKRNSITLSKLSGSS